MGSIKRNSSSSQCHWHQHKLRLSSSCAGERNKTLTKQTSFLPQTTFPFVSAAHLATDRYQFLRREGIVTPLHTIHKQRKSNHLNKCTCLDGNKRATLAEVWRACCCESVPALKKLQRRCDRAIVFQADMRDHEPPATRNPPRLVFVHRGNRTGVSPIDLQWVTAESWAGASTGLWNETSIRTHDPPPAKKNQNKDFLTSRPPDAVPTVRL